MLLLVGKGKYHRFFKIGKDFKLKPKFSANAGFTHLISFNVIETMYVCSLLKICYVWINKRKVSKSIILLFKDTQWLAFMFLIPSLLLLCVYTQRRGREGKKGGSERERKRDGSISILMESKCAYCYAGLFHLIHHEYISMSIHFHQHNLKYRIEF